VRRQKIRASLAVLGVFAMCSLLMTGSAGHHDHGELAVGIGGKFGDHF